MSYESESIMAYKYFIPISYGLRSSDNPKSNCYIGHILAASSRQQYKHHYFDWFDCINLAENILSYLFILDR